MKDSKTHSFGSYDRDAGSNYIWTARVRSKGTDEATVYARNQSFTVCGQASFRSEDAYPSAVEYLLGALGADLACGFARQADRRGVSPDALEVSISGRLNNPLRVLGVIGETGHAGFEMIRATLYVSADADQAVLQQIWTDVLACSPTVNTLRLAVDLQLDLQITQ